MVILSAEPGTNGFGEWHNVLRLRIGEWDQEDDAQEDNKTSLGWNQPEIRV